MQVFHFIGFAYLTHYLITLHYGSASLSPFAPIHLYTLLLSYKGLSEHRTPTLCLGSCEEQARVRTRNQWCDGSYGSSPLEMSQLCLSGLLLNWHRNAKMRQRPYLPLSTVTIAMPQKILHLLHYPGGIIFTKNGQCDSAPSFFWYLAPRNLGCLSGCLRVSILSTHLGLLFPSSSPHLKPFPFSYHPSNLTFQPLRSFLSIFKLKEGAQP